MSMEQSINSLFGSKTRVKLLNLFLNNPDEKFYVREISRTIDEQVNSVRRELTNLEGVGVVKSSTEDRKIFYGANQRFKYYIPLRAIFAGTEIAENQDVVKNTPSDSWLYRIDDIKKFIDIVIIAGVLVDDSDSNVDMLLVGDNSGGELSLWAGELEKSEGRELNYVILAAEDFYYRYTTQDTFIKNIFENKHLVVFDKEGLTKE